MGSQGQTLKVVLTAVGIAAPILYSFWYLRKLSDSITTTTQKVTVSSTLPLPDEVLSNPSDFVVSHEHAEKVLPASSLPADHMDLTKLYLRSAMQSFARLPQAWIIYFILKSPDRTSFGSSYLQKLDFEIGDRICGVYKVAKKEQESIQLDLSPPPSYTGPAVRGNIISGVHPSSDGTVLFTNDVYLWRKINESPTMLESTMGRYLHFLTAAYVLNSGSNHLIQLAKS